MSPRETSEWSGPGTQRRTFLKITGAAAAMAPGVALLGGVCASPDWQEAGGVPVEEDPVLEGRQEPVLCPRPGGLPGG